MKLEEVKRIQASTLVKVGPAVRSMQTVYGTVENVIRIADSQLEPFYEKGFTSLEGSPDTIDSDFNIGHNKLTSLAHGPSRVFSSFKCDYNKLTSLKGAPRYVGASFSCMKNKLKTLIDGPEHVGRDYQCSHNQLTSLEGIAKTLHWFYADNNELTSLKDIHLQIQQANFITFEDNPIKSHVLGLLKIKTLRNVVLGFHNKQNSTDLTLKRVSAIINHHLKGDRDIFACQEELEDAGFEEYAQL